MSAAAELSSDAVDLCVFAEYDRDFTEETDVAVVGSGPGGAVIAKELAEAGIRVVLLDKDALCGRLRLTSI